MIGMICVLTGDIVGSTRLESGELDQLMTGLAEGANEIRHWTEPPALPLWVVGVRSGRRGQGRRGQVV